MDTTSLHQTFAYAPSNIARDRAIALKNEIEAFHAEYCAVLDTGNVEDWPMFFVEDGLYRVTARENAERGLPVGLVYAEGRNMMHDRALAIGRTQMFAPRYTLHMVNNVRVVSEDADGAIGAHANFMLLQTLVEGPTTVHLAGCYRDVFVRVEGELKLKNRQVIYDTNILANDLVYPV